MPWLFIYWSVTRTLYTTSMWTWLGHASWTKQKSVCCFGSPSQCSHCSWTPQVLIQFFWCAPLQLPSPCYDTVHNPRVLNMQCVTCILPHLGLQITPGNQLSQQPLFALPLRMPSYTQHARVSAVSHAKVLCWQHWMLKCNAAHAHAKLWQVMSCNSVGPV